MSFFKKIKTNIEKEENLAEPEKTKEKPGKKTKKKEIPEIKLAKDNQDWLDNDGQLTVDVFQTTSEFCVQAPIAGVNIEDINVAVENEMLIIKGERKEPESNKEKNYFYQECYWGPFSREIILPEKTDASKVKASLQKGILLIRIPKVNKITKKKINVISEE